MGIYSKLGGRQAATTLDHVIEDLSAQQRQTGTGMGFTSREAAVASLSMEGIDDNLNGQLTTAVEGLSACLESICDKYQAPLTKAQKMAGVVAGISMSDPKSFLMRPPVATGMVSTEHHTYVAAGGADQYTERNKAALEAYDERDTRLVVNYSVAYNLNAARQDEFGEAFFPTVVVTPDQVGYSVSIRLITVMNDLKRNISGALDQFNRRNVIHALIDPTILHNDQTKITPVYRDESAHNFLPTSLLAPKDVLVDTETITTSALKMGVSFSLLGISQTQALLDTGLMDVTDSIDTAAALKGLYLQLGTGNDAELFHFNTLRLPGSVMNHAVQGNARLMNLSFSGQSFLVNENTKKVNGAASTILAPLASGNYSVRLGVNVSGSINLQTAATNFYASAVTVVRVDDADGNTLSLESGEGKTIADLFATAAMVGYDLDAQRANMNRRERGQLLDTTYYNQTYTVPLRAPITVPRPLTSGDVNDSSDLAALITTTHIRASIAAVKEIFEVADTLAAYIDKKDSLAEAPDILGVTRFMITPFYERTSFNVQASLDSLSSHNRTEDIQALLVNKIREVAYRAYRDSGWEAAAIGMSGGVPKKPTVIVGTDLMIANWLMVTGDYRTLGNEFEMKVVKSLNQDMVGKIVIAFGDFSAATEGVANPMHFGNMAWKPELVSTLPLYRSGSNSKELTVAPSFKHIVNTPVLAIIDVTGLTEVAATKVPLRIAQ